MLPTKDLLAGLKAGKPATERASTDDDFGHCAKYVPLLASYAHDKEALLSATRTLVLTSQRGEYKALTGEWLAPVPRAAAAG